jgi:D-tagatose-1,6-bisphosphate aldolase subunit GatZ/KbaZ
LRHYSLSDRIRYYWGHPQAAAAVDRLMQALHGKTLPLPLLWQHLPAAAGFADRPLDPEALLVWRVTQSIETYHRAGLPRPLSQPNGGI